MPDGKTPWEQASEWFARTIAIVLVMVAPGAAGAWLDSQLGTNFIAAIGFAFGMVLAITLLMIFARIKPIANDGDIMKRHAKLERPLNSPDDSRQLGDSRQPGDSSQAVRPTAGQKPSESELPNIPGAEILESRPDE